MSVYDEKFMREAIKEAKKGFDADEVPVGAVLVYQGEIIARAHNRVEELKDASAHAEMLCMKEAADVFKNWRLLETTLYCTLEPCMMCAGCMLLSRVETLVWGAKDVRHGANGSFINIFLPSHPTHQLMIRSGILEEECASLMKDFFKAKRNAKII